MVKYTTFKAKKFKNANDEYERWVVAYGDDGSSVKLAKIAHWVRYPDAAARAIALSLEENKTITIVDLV